MNWLVLVLISAFTNSLTRVFQKVLLVEKENDPFAFGFVFQLIVALVMLIWALASGFNIPNLSNVWQNLVLMSLFYSLGNLTIFYAFKKAEASEVSVIFASSAVWSVLSAILFLSESLSMIKIFATILVFIGVGIIYYSRSKWKLNVGHLLALLSAFFFGVAFTNDAFILREFSSVPSYMFIAFLMPSILTLFFKPKLVNNLKFYLTKKILLKTVVTAMFYGVAAVTIFQAYKMGGEASVISPISQMSVVITVIIGYIFLRERENLLNKSIGALLVIGGAILIR